MIDTQDPFEIAEDDLRNLMHLYNLQHSDLHKHLETLLYDLQDRLEDLEALQEPLEDLEAKP